MTRQLAGRTASGGRRSPRRTVLPLLAAVLSPFLLTVSGLGVCGPVGPLGTSSDAGSWNGSTWAGATWAGATWAGATWAGATWAGATWAGATWAGDAWTGSTWASASWR